MCSTLVPSRGLFRIFAYRHIQCVARLFLHVAYVGSLFIERGIHSVQGACSFAWFKSDLCLKNNEYTVCSTGFQSSSVQLGFWIPTAGGIPDSLSCIPDSRAQDFGFHKQKFPRFRNSDSLTWGERVAASPALFPTFQFAELRLYTI